MPARGLAGPASPPLALLAFGEARAVDPGPVLVPRSEADTRVTIDVKSARVGGLSGRRRSG